MLLRTLSFLPAIYLFLPAPALWATPYSPDPLDVSQPSNSVVAAGVDGTSPGGQGPSSAIDNSLATKYVNFAPEGAGLLISTGSLSIVNELRIYTGNSTVLNDPASFTLEGSIDGIGYTLIAAGALSLPASRNVDNSTNFHQAVLFSNSTAYDRYRVIFPTNQGGGSLQFSEIELVPEPSAFALLGAMAIVLRCRICRARSTRKRSAGTFT